MLKELTLETIKDVADGKVEAALLYHIKRAAEDCLDRPGSKAARTIKLVMKIKPVIDSDGLCESANVEFEIDSSVPKHVSRPVNCNVRKGGKLAFNDMSEDDAKQMTIDESR